MMDGDRCLNKISFVLYKQDFYINLFKKKQTWYVDEFEKSNVHALLLLLLERIKEKKMFILLFFLY